ncbi:hypothetical protein FGADI_10723 [Fusarium gaditjirri]|uniref:Heterokaryon incompatibility domain-containing protein n=1 Tax=Fusarium gaditjirri TaxID=282569 RepID=A0A8H4SWX1_9HYPO|nr:hypothetical protein FGADI_10723 [Fusarium gaditjirri]
MSILNKFFSRSYFARLWVVQELFLAQSITMHCGEVSIRVTNESISQLYEQGVKVPSWVRFAGKANSNTERTPFNLIDLLAATTACRVTDLRDKIFGSLGLVGNVQASQLTPDYQLMVREVYIGVAAYLIQKDHRCDLIQHAHRHWVHYNGLDRETVYVIPSWVPMWDKNTPLQDSQGLTSLCDKPEDDKHFTNIWNLKDGMQLVIRCFASTFSYVYTGSNVHLIRVEGSPALFLAYQASDSLKYRLLDSCIAAIVCPTQEPSSTEILGSDDLHRLLQFTPLTVEMIQFISRWRNGVFDLARSDPQDREHILPIEDQSCHYFFGDEPKISRRDWRSWIPFLALETRQTMEDDRDLQKQFPRLIDFWHEAHVLHTAIRDWTKGALAVSDHRRIMGWYKLPQQVQEVLSDFLSMSDQLAETFKTITGSKFILQSLLPLRLLLDLLADSEVQWAGRELLGYHGGQDGLLEDYECLVLALNTDQFFLDQAFPVDIKDIHHEYSNMEQTIRWKPEFEGLVRGNAEAKDVTFI